MPKNYSDIRIETTATKSLFNMIGECLLTAGDSLTVTRVYDGGVHVFTRNKDKAEFAVPGQWLWDCGAFRCYNNDRAIPDQPTFEVFLEKYNGYKLLDTPIYPNRYKIERDGNYVKSNAGCHYFPTLDKAKNAIDKYCKDKL